MPVLLFSLLFLVIFQSSGEILSHSEGPGVMSDLYILRLRVDLLTKQLEQNCPQELKADPFLKGRLQKRALLTAKQRVMYGHSIAVERGVFNHILGLLEKCLDNGQQYNKTTPTNKSTKTTTSTTTSTTTTTTTTPQTKTTTMTPTAPTRTTLSPTSFDQRCPLQVGYSKIGVDLINYRNPGNNKAPDIQRDSNTDNFVGSIYVEVCVGPIGARNCTLYNIKTSVIKSSMLVVFGSDIGGYSNPFDIDLGLRPWQGVNIGVNIWQRDNTSVTDDMVDKFSYDFTDQPGTPSRTIDVESVGDPPKSWLKLQLRNYCPTPVTLTTESETATTDKHITAKDNPG